MVSCGVFAVLCCAVSWVGLEQAAVSKRSFDALEMDGWSTKRYVM